MEASGTPLELADRVPCTPRHIRYRLRGKRNMSKVMFMHVRNLPGERPSALALKSTRGDGGGCQGYLGAFRTRISSQERVSAVRRRRRHGVRRV